MMTPAQLSELGSPQAGDFAVIRTRGWAAWVIRVVTRSKYNHAVFFISPTEIVEAEGQGAIISSWSKYAKSKTRTSAGLLPLTPEQRAAAPAVGRSLVGIPYGWLDIFSVGLLQYGIKPELVRHEVSTQRNLICSQLADKARLLLGDHLFNDNRLPQDVTPGDLDILIEHAANAR